MPSITMVLVWFSQQFSLNYRESEDGFHRLYQNQLTESRNPPTYEYPGEAGIAKGHPTKLEGEVV